MSNEKCCKNCVHFCDEDINGTGLCCMSLVRKITTYRYNCCVAHEWKLPKWTEITPKNVEDALKTKEMFVVAHYVDKRLIKEVLPFEIDNNQLEKILSTMAELGGFYYYVLPELNIDGTK